jgi:GDPmannose 4,6-dehydratase
LSRKGSTEGDRKSSLIIGSNGQDGYYLRELLRKHGHVVFGLSRDALEVEEEVFPPTDLGSREAVERLITHVCPSEIYFLAAHHHSSEEGQGQLPDLLEKSMDTHVVYLAHVLDAICRHQKECRVFYASSCHVFGNPKESPQTEQTAIDPVDPYGISKASGMWLCRYYRQQHGLFASTGILYNHESPRRPLHFAIRKIVRMALNARDGKINELVVGDLNAEADWGFAPDYVDAMRLILGLDEPGDFIIASGQLHTIQTVIDTVFEELGLPPSTRVREEKKILKRKLKGEPLVGDARKLMAATGWRSQKGLREIIKSMIEAEDANHE